MSADPSVVAVNMPPPIAAAGQHAAPDSAAEPADQLAAPRRAAAGSALLSLRARKQQMAELLYTDLRVPRWGEVDDGPAIWVRYGPASPSEFSDRIEKMQKNKNRPKDWAVNANAQVLVSSCIGVFAIEGADDYEYEKEQRPRLSLRDDDPHGDWTKFDPDLAYSLGLDEHAGAIAVVRALYLTEADVTSTATKLLQWSGMVLPNQNKDFSDS